MGLVIARFYFDHGIPSVKEIREKFKLYTGLDILIKAYVNLLELPVNSREVVEKLNQDINKYDQLENKGDWSKWKEESHKINHIDRFQFYNIQFYGIDFRIEKKIIEIEYGVGCYYFSTSLNKVLHSLGGRFVNEKNEPTNGFENHKAWNKLKHWDDYKWYNRPWK